MKKLMTMCLLAGALTHSLCAEHTEYSENDQRLAGGEEVVVKGGIPPVTTAEELTAAITAASLSLKEPVTILIEGVIVGNFEVPASPQPISLVGVGVWCSH